MAYIKTISLNSTLEGSKRKREYPTKERTSIGNMSGNAYRVNEQDKFNAEIIYSVIDTLASSINKDIFLF